MSLPSDTTTMRRRIIGFPAEILRALELLALDSDRTVQSLAEEAFIDLLRKYQRPISLKEALLESRRRIPANDDSPPKRRAP